jgi:transcriptional regulator with XRE-family HTH domain
MTATGVQLLRERLGRLTQEEFAAHMHVTTRTVARWENKSTPLISPFALERLLSIARSSGEERAAQIFEQALDQASKLKRGRGWVRQTASPDLPQTPVERVLVAQFLENYRRGPVLNFIPLPNPCGDFLSDDGY